MADEHVLLIDPQQESRRDLHFLLRLSQCRVTTFKYLDEAFNWMTCPANQQDRVDLVAIKNLSETDDFIRFVNNLGNAHLSVPVLIVISNKEDFKYLDICLKCNFYMDLDWCLVEDFHLKLRTIKADRKEISS
jgi:DNA-binding NtrC family response regulator